MEQLTTYLRIILLNGIKMKNVKNQVKLLIVTLLLGLMTIWAGITNAQCITPSDLNRAVEETFEMMEPESVDTLRSILTAYAMHKEYRVTMGGLEYYVIARQTPNRQRNCWVNTYLVVSLWGDDERGFIYVSDDNYENYHQYCTRDLLTLFYESNCRFESELEHFIQEINHTRRWNRR